MRDGDWPERVLPLTRSKKSHFQYFVISSEWNVNSPPSFTWPFISYADVTMICYTSPFLLRFGVVICHFLRDKPAVLRFMNFHLCDETTPSRRTHALINVTNTLFQPKKSIILKIANFVTLNNYVNVERRKRKLRQRIDHSWMVDAQNIWSICAIELITAFGWLCKRNGAHFHLLFYLLGIITFISSKKTHNKFHEWGGNLRNSVGIIVVRRVIFKPISRVLKFVNDVIKVSIDTNYVSHFVQFNSIVIQMIFVHSWCSKCSWANVRA